jgi:glucarate dehydratase
MRVIPVAGRRQHAAQLSGAHGPFFTRNLVLVEDSAGDAARRGAAGASDPRTLEEARAARRRAPLGERALVLGRVRARFGDRDAGGRGAQTFDSARRSTRITAVSRAARLTGQLSALPVAALLGDGAPRESVTVLGYLFFVGDRARGRARRTAAPSAATMDAPARRGGADARGDRAPAEAAHARVRLRRLQAEGGRLAATRR